MFSLSTATAMKVKDFFNSAESEVRSGWTEQHGTIGLHWFFRRGLIREAMVARTHWTIPCIIDSSLTLLWTALCSQLFTCQRISSLCVSNAKTLLNHRERFLRTLNLYCIVPLIHIVFIHNFSVEPCMKQNFAFPIEIGRLNEWVFVDGWF